MALASKAGSYNDISGRLRGRWWGAVGLCLAILLGSYVLVVRGNPSLNHSQWILQALTVTVYVLVLLRLGLVWNYQTDQRSLKSTLGYGTWLGRRNSPRFARVIRAAGAVDAHTVRLHQRPRDRVSAGCRVAGIVRRRA